VLINLLDNAIKYTPQAFASPASTVLPRKFRSLFDTGPIPEENRDRIFEDRFRLKRDEARDGCGSIYATDYSSALWSNLG